jgi:hypothetical protein
LRLLRIFMIGRPKTALWLKIEAAPLWASPVKVKAGEAGFPNKRVVSRAGALIGGAGAGRNDVERLPGERRAKT